MVTAIQVGLGSVNNTADANKPVSTAQQAALNAKQNTALSAATIAALGLPAGATVGDALIKIYNTKNFIVNMDAQIF
jgi:hypothetical protein